MRFSIRDLFLVTMIVALALGWGVTRWQLADAKLDAEVWQDLAREFNDKLNELERTTKASRELPNSSAPAPNPPNP